MLTLVTAASLAVPAERVGIDRARTAALLEPTKAPAQWDSEGGLARLAVATSNKEAGEAYLQVEPSVMRMFTANETGYDVGISDELHTAWDFQNYIQRLWHPGAPRECRGLSTRRRAMSPARMHPFLASLHLLSACTRRRQVACRAATCSGSATWAMGARWCATRTKCSMRAATA